MDVSSVVLIIQPLCHETVVSIQGHLHASLPRGHWKSKLPLVICELSYTSHCLPVLKKRTHNQSKKQTKVSAKIILFFLVARQNINHALQMSSTLMYKRHLRWNRIDTKYQVFKKTHGVKITVSNDRHVNFIVIGPWWWITRIEPPPLPPLIKKEKPTKQTNKKQTTTKNQTNKKWRRSQLLLLSLQLSIVVVVAVVVDRTAFVVVVVLYSVRSERKVGLVSFIGNVVLFWMPTFTS